MTPVDYAVVISFLAALAIAGLWISRLIKDSDDFFVAGRELTPFILCATITATNISMLHFIGMGGVAYKSGVSILWQNWTGCIALVCSGIFVIPLMRRLRIRSVPEFLEMRYSRGLRTLIGAFWGLRLCTFLGLLLYVAATTAIIITGSAQTTRNYVLWLFAFSLVSVLYSVIGGAWAVAIMDSVQFVIMLAGGMIILGAAAYAAGGLPAVFDNLRATSRAQHLDLVPIDGAYDWLFILSITLLSFKFASVDQAILQRAFGAKSPRVGAQGMVLSAIVTMPLALFWVLPGLAAAKLHPGFDNPDYAMPWLFANTIPVWGRGLLGFVLCGLLAAQVSTITADVNSVATLFTSDLYRTLRRTEPSQRQLLLVVRISSLVCGLIMLVVAYLIRRVGTGAVDINLKIVGILDMPLFVVTIIYGLLWKRANWQGALAGFLAGGAVGLAAHYLVPSLHLSISPVTVRNLVPLLSSGTALVVTPIVSLLTPPGRSLDWETLSHDEFRVLPTSPLGRLGLAFVILGVVAFLTAILCRPLGATWSSPVAVAAVVAVFAGGLTRAYSR